VIYGKMKVAGKVFWACALQCCTHSAFLILFKNSCYFFVVLEDDVDSYSLVARSRFNLKSVSFLLWKMWNCPEMILQLMLERGISTWAMLFFWVESKRCEFYGQACSYN